MESVALQHDHFKKIAFTWKPVFSHRQIKLYKRENDRLVPPSNIPVTTKEIVKAFLNYQCTDDVQRYSSRNLQISKFLEGTDMETLRNNYDATLKPTAILDDRNNENVSRINLSGNIRTIPSPLQSHELFNALSLMVCKYPDLRELTNHP